ncbi:FimV/HubP family polar landmark protein [Vibrio sp. F74]|uniref:FimV/HubP family polar landmark protein n=1 Tax=Vibrio sp. F74 TaxID=700020 RepID=UPI0035F5B2F2
MHPILKRLITPLALLLTVSADLAVAESIRLIGPDGEVQSSVQVTQQATQPSNTSVSNTVGNSANFYGPTANNETLWSIATKLRPSRRYSVQQTLLAIYKLNPQAFDQQNIHELRRGSRLRVPSLEQVQAENTNEAVRIMQAHNKQQKGTTVVSSPVAKPAPITETDLTPPQAPKQPKPIEVAAVENNEVKVDSKQREHVTKLKQDLTTTEGELAALEEKNHKLRLMLTDVQDEVGNLKDELGDESRIRDEVEKLLGEERKKALETAQIEPSQLDMLLANTWFVVLLALIPGLLFVLIIVLLLTRKGGAEQPQEQLIPEGPEVISLMDDDSDDVPEINLDEDIDEDVGIDDDLFGELSDENIFDIDDEDEQLAEDDVFANLDDSDLDFNLDDGEDDPFASIADNGDFDTDLDKIEQSANGISVDGDEEALSLEDMERALDNESSGDENEFESEFDLSDESGMSQDDLDELLAGEDDAEALASDEIDQSALDDLFNSVKEENSNESDLDDFDLDSGDEKNNSDSDDIDDILSSYQPTATQNDAAESDDIDDILSSYQPTATQNDGAESDDIDDILSSYQPAATQNDAAESDDIDDILANYQMETESMDADSIDDLLAENSTDLLDDVLEQEDAAAELSEDSTALLDDLLDDEDSNDDDIPELSENSTELLDELFDAPESSDDSELDLEDNTALLDELISDDGDDVASASDDIEISEDSTALLDELLEDAEKESGEMSTDPDDLLAEFGIEPQAGEGSIGEESDLDENSTDLLDELLSEDEPFDGLLEREVSALTDSDITQKGRFDFTPHIDGSEHADKIEELDDIDSYMSEIEDFDVEESVEEKKEVDYEPPTESVDDAIVHPDEKLSDLKDEAIANEFGTPQDEDWDLETDEKPEASEESTSVDAQELDTLAEIEPDALEEPTETLELNDGELGEYDEPSALSDVLQEQELDTLEKIEPEALEERTEVRELSDDKLGEDDEVNTLNDALQESKPDTLVEIEPEALEEPTETLELNDDELGEDDEINTLNDGLQEPEPDTLVEIEPEALGEPTEALELSDDELGEYDETSALIDVLQEPDLETLPEIDPELLDEPTETLELNDDELGEYDEVSALSDVLQEPDLEILPEIEPESLREPTETLELNDDELGEYDEASALSDVLHEPDLETIPENDSERLEEPEKTLGLRGDGLDDDDEKNELSALLNDVKDDTSPAEPSSEDRAELEKTLNFVSEKQETTPEKLSELDAIFNDSGNEQQQKNKEEIHAFNEAVLSEKEESLDEFDSFFAEMDDSDTVAKGVDDSVREVDDKKKLEQYDESATLAELLSDDESPALRNDVALDEKMIASAGMDIDTMLDVGGEDWNGFALSEEQQANIPTGIPEDEQDVWGPQTEEPVAQEEDWGEQSEIDAKSLEDEQTFMSVDELMAQADVVDANEIDPDEEELKLDVGLNEFPDVIGNVEQFDVDANAEAAGKLDLAKIYIEMNDTEGATRLLEEALLYGEEDIRQQARELLDKIENQ